MNMKNDIEVNEPNTRVGYRFSTSHTFKGAALHIIIKSNMSHVMNGKMIYNFKIGSG